MRFRLLATLAIVCVAFMGVRPANAQFAQMYYSPTDPGNHKPGAGGVGNPWVAGGAAIPVPPNVGDMIWLGMRNVTIPTNTKEWSVKVGPPLSTKFGFVSANGYVAGAPPQSRFGVLVPGTPAGTFVVRFTPQPDWEVIKLQRFAASALAGEVDADIEGSSHCSQTTIGNTSVSLSNARFGIQAEDNIRITELRIFPVTNIAVDPPGSQAFTAPGSTGTWTASSINTDPNGGIHAGGIRWLSNGTGLTPTDVYTLTLNHPAGNVSEAYDYYAFDDVEDAWSYFRITTISVPTVSEWGIAVMTLLVLTAATIVIRGRRPAVA